MSVTITRGSEEPVGGLGVPLVLDEDVEDVAVLVHGPPEVVQPPVGLDEDLVEVPFVPGAGSPAAQSVGVGLPELGAPLAHRS